MVLGNELELVSPVGYLSRGDVDEAEDRTGGRDGPSLSGLSEDFDPGVSGISKDSPLSSEHLSYCVRVLFQRIQHDLDPLGLADDSRTHRQNVGFS